MTFGLPHARSNEPCSNGCVMSRDKLETFEKLKSHGKLLKNRKYEVPKPPLKPPAEPTLHAKTISFSIPLTHFSIITCQNLLILLNFIFMNRKK